MMQISNEKLLRALLCDLIILANGVGLAVTQAKSFKPQCRKMRKKVVVLSQKLQILRQYTTSTATMSLVYLKDQCLFSIKEVSKILQEALTLASSCKHKTIFCRLFPGPKTAKFHQLYHLLENSHDKMNWLVILLNPDFGEMVFHFLPQIIRIDASALSALSWIDTEDMIWTLATMLTSETSQLELKLYCAEALSMLNVGSILKNKATNQEIEELIFHLAKMVEAEHDQELQCYCLTIMMKIISAAEHDRDPRCKTFKTNTGVKGIIKMLSRVIEETYNPELQILAIKYIGSLARIFYERNNQRVIKALVSQLESIHPKVAKEALVGLQKFACPSNFLCKAHSNRMVELNAVGPMVKLMRDGESGQQVQGLVLMCYIAMSADYSQAIEKVRVATAIRELTGKSEDRSRRIVSQHPELKDLVSKALSRLNLYYKF